MLISNFFHLTYCTNIHPGENWAVTFDSLKKHLLEVKQRVATNEKFGVGLRLSNKASEELGLGEKLYKFKDWLDANGLYVFTMNGFPYGNFHGEEVKDNVHQPDWTTSKRLEYTKRLFSQLAVLLPENHSGGISTSPISYRHWFTNEIAINNAKKTGADHMLVIAEMLFTIEAKSGKYMHLDIEPEPDGILENSDEVLDFFNDYLIPQGVQKFKASLNLDEEKAISVIKRYLTVCYDICHFSLAYEAPVETFSKFSANNITIGKIQVSAALKILFNGQNDAEVWKALENFNEPTYLHQVTELTSNGVKTYADLPVVLKEKNVVKELRGHFHIPIFLEDLSPLGTTQDHILKVIAYLKQNQICEHLEIETYTWEVLPLELKKELSDSIVREIEWFKNKLV